MATITRLVRTPSANQNPCWMDNMRLRLSRISNHCFWSNLHEISPTHPRVVWEPGRASKGHERNIQSLGGDVAGLRAFPGLSQSEGGSVGKGSQGQKKDGGWVSASWWAGPTPPPSFGGGAGGFGSRKAPPPSPQHPENGRGGVGGGA